MTTRDLPLAPVGDAPCCAPLASATISLEDAQLLARRLKAIADPARLRLVSLIAAQETGEACVCDLTEPLGLTQGTVSHHVKVLLDAGILAREKRGTWAHYSVKPDALAELGTILGSA